MLEYESISDAILANTAFRGMTPEQRTLNGRTIYSGPLRTKEQLKQGSRATFAYRLQSKFPTHSTN
eukprot:670260-Prorocentrum_lima.AAC.1